MFGCIAAMRALEDEARQIRKSQPMSEADAVAQANILINPESAEQLFELALSAINRQPFDTLIARINGLEHNGQLFLGDCSFLHLVAAAVSRGHNSGVTFFQIEFDVVADTMSVAIPEALSGNARLLTKKRIEELLQDDGLLTRLLRS